MGTSDRGLGSSNMDEQTKKDIQSKGGHASHGGNSRNVDVTTNRSGGGRLDKNAQRRGGQNSHSNQNS